MCTCITLSPSLPLPSSAVSTLFFTGDLPDTISAAQDLSALCTNLLPDLPASSVTVISDSGLGVSYSYCEVESARGTFRSESVVVRDTGEWEITASLSFTLPFNIFVA